MQLNMQLCSEIFNLKDEFCNEAQKVWQAYNGRKDISLLQQQLRYALINNHFSEQGSGVLNEIVSSISKTSQAQADIYAVCALGALLPEALAYYRRIGASDSVARASLGDVGRWIDNYAITHNGAYGINEFSWAVHTFAGNLFEIGSLQYQMRTNRMPYYIYMYRGKLVVVPQQGLNISADGHLYGTNGTHNDIAFTTELYERDNCIIANKVNDEAAIITQEKIELNINEAKLITACGMPILFVHIPKNTDLSMSAVESSLSEAKQFFTKLNYPCTVGMCCSWILDAEQKSIMKQDGNLAKFSAKFTHFPLYNVCYSGGRFVFNVDYTSDDLHNVVPQTSLAKKMHQHLLQGKELYEAGGAILL
ncbi:MAG: acyltransferase domain-containing protein [Oscillospiraceae bacterium]